MENIKIEYAKIKDIDAILNLLEERCIWMEKNNISQWKSHSYTVTFNHDYFLEQIKKQKVYVARIENKVCGIFLLNDIDQLWEYSSDAFYIHHFASNINYPGLGKIMMSKIKEIALENNKSKIRLDCVKENGKLNKYYENLGFSLIKSGIRKTYHYNLWELLI